MFWIEKKKTTVRRVVSLQCSYRMTGLYILAGNACRPHQEAPFGQGTVHAGYPQPGGSPLWCLRPKRPQGPSFSNPTFIVRSHHPGCRATQNNAGKGARKCSLRSFLLTAIFMASTLPDKMCFQGHLKATHLRVKYPGPELHLPVSKGLKLFLPSQVCIECVPCAGYCGEPWRHSEWGRIPAMG